MLGFWRTTLKIANFEARGLDLEDFLWETLAVTVLAESLRGPGLWCLPSGAPLSNHPQNR